MSAARAYGRVTVTLPANAPRTPTRAASQRGARVRDRRRAPTMASAKRSGAAELGEAEEALLRHVDQRLLQRVDVLTGRGHSSLRDLRAHRA